MIFPLFGVISCPPFEDAAAQLATVLRDNGANAFALEGHPSPTVRVVDALLSCGVDPQVLALSFPSLRLR